jgi:hypothetical protein
MINPIMATVCAVCPAVARARNMSRCNNQPSTAAAASVAANAADTGTFAAVT